MIDTKDQKYKSAMHFIRNTILTVILWSGLWGIISLIVHSYVTSFEGQFITYLAMAIFAFYLLKEENINE